MRHASILEYLAQIRKTYFKSTKSKKKLPERTSAPSYGIFTGIHEEDKRQKNESDRRRYNYFFRKKDCLKK